MQSIETIPLFDKIATQYGENFGDLHELVIIKVMQLSLYWVKIWVKILSL